MTLKALQTSKPCYNMQFLIADNYESQAAETLSARLPEVTGTSRRSKIMSKRFE